MYMYVNQFLKERDVAEVTRQRYKNSLEQFFKWLTLHTIIHPQKEHIVSYKESMEKRGLKIGTRAAYIVALRCFFTWLDDNNLYKNIARTIKIRKAQSMTHSRDPLKVEEAIGILNAIDPSNLEGKRDIALINLLIRTGIRLIEAQRANIDDIEARNGKYVLWIHAKGADDKDKFVILTQNTLDPLMEYLKARNTKPWDALFGSVSMRNFNERMTTYSLSRIVKKRMRNAGINSHRLTAHSLRHTFGTLAIKAGSDINAVQLAMHHTSPTTTQIYIRDIQQEKRIENCAALCIDALLPPII